MVLSADDLGIRKGLIPFFCCDCGSRLGWAEDEPDSLYLYCEDCARKEKEDEED